MLAQRHRVWLAFVGVRLTADDGFEDLFRPFVAEVGTAKHEKRRDHPREKITQSQGSGKQENKLVSKRSYRDLTHNRQFALSIDPEHVARSDCCVVDDDARR